MMPIQDLFNKLKWDPNENPFLYTFFYFDRVANKLREVKYKDIAEVKDGYMTIVKEEGEAQIPLHRIRVVKKGAEVVWERKVKISDDAHITIGGMKDG
jgi:uncharacterized protein (UPF0248 family)